MVDLMAAIAGDVEEILIQFPGKLKKMFEISFLLVNKRIF